LIVLHIRHNHSSSGVSLEREWWPSSIFSEWEPHSSLDAVVVRGSREPLADMRKPRYFHSDARWWWL